MAQAYVLDDVGRRSRRTRSFSSRGAAEAWLDACQREVQNGDPHRRRSPITLADFGRRWIGSVLPDRVALGKIKPATYESYSWAWDHIADGLGHLTLTAITPARVESWEARLLQSDSVRRTPFAPASVRNMHRVLHRALNDATRMGYIERNPIEGLEQPKGPVKEVRPLHLAEAKALLAAAEGDRLEALWWVLLTLGLRIGEAAGLRWSDFNDGWTAVTISRTVRRQRRPADGRPRTTRLVEGPTKTNTRATLHVPDNLQAVLRQHSARQADERARASRWDDADLVFTTPVGTHLEPRNLARKVASLADQADIERHVHPHMLRHTTATLLVPHVPMRVIQELMRHERESTTSRLYAHVLPEAAVAGAALIDGLLGHPQRADDDSTSACGTLADGR